MIVLELSSYQTELARALTPDMAVFTNLSPDHLDRHGGMGGYFAAKRRLFAEGGPDRAIIGVDEVEGQFLAGQLAEAREDARVIRISSGQKLAGPGWNIFARKGFLAEYRAGRQVASIDLRAMPGLPGAHNHQNACAAYAVARSLGAAPRLIEDAMASFTGLPHRSQLVAEAGGVRYINDSKATNAESAAKALQAFDRIRWIAGGLGKDGGIAPLCPASGPRDQGLSDRPFRARVCPATGRAPARGLRHAGTRHGPRHGRGATGRHRAAGPRRRQFRPVPRFRGAGRGLHRRRASGA